MDENSNFLNDLKNSLDNEEIDLTIVNRINNINEKADLVDFNRLRKKILTERENTPKINNLENYQSLESPIEEIESENLRKDLKDEKQFVLFANLSNKIWEYNKIKGDLEGELEENYNDLLKNNLSSVLINEMKMLKEKNYELFNRFEKK